MAKRTRTASAGKASAASYSPGIGLSMDSMQNLVSGMGTEKDKRFSTFFGLGLMDRAQLDAAYRGDWISRKAVDIPAYDATREWREWQADPDDVTELETHEKDLNIQQKVMSALIKGRLYGGAALILGIDDGLPPDQPVELDRLDFDCLSFVHVVTRFELAQGPLIWDIMSPFYGEPEYYMQSGSGSNGVKLHPSRVVKFIGNEIPDMNVSDGWGDSILQAVSDAIIGAGTVSSSMAQLVAEAKLDVIKIPGLSENIVNADYEARLKKRFGFANTVKSVFSMLLLDKEEEWERINSQFAGMPDVLKTFLLMACGAVDVPATRFLGQSPQGLSSTGDSDTRNYYDRVTTEQKVIIQPKLNKLDAVLKRSALGMIPADGSDDDIFYIWRPLWSMTEAEKADVATKKAAVAKTDSDMGLINTVVLKKAREAQLVADGTYPGLLQLIEEFDDDPEMNEKNAESAALEAQLSGTPPITDPNDPNYDPTKDPAAPEFANVQAALPAPKGQPTPPKVKKGAKNVAIDAIVRRMQDASTPRTLYVRRDLLPASAKKLRAWAKSVGFDSAVNDMHVTVVYSKTPVDWLEMGSDWQDAAGELTVKAGGPRVMEKFGTAVVLAFSSSDLSYRHRSMVERGAEHGYPDYTPHVTITYNGGAQDLLMMVPYQGELIFGPEVFEQIKPDFNNETDIVEDGDTNFFVDAGTFEEQKHPRDKDGKFVMKGTASERVKLRKQLKDEMDPKKRVVMQQRIMASFVKERDKAVNSADGIKLSELNAKIAKYSKLYNMPNPLNVSGVIAAHGTVTKPSSIATGGLKSVVPHNTTESLNTTGYSPREISAFKTLTDLDGGVGGASSAKMWMLRGKAKVAENQALAARGLDAIDAAHIAAYSGHAYRKVNSQLRMGSVDENVFSHRRDLSKAINKLPDHVGTVYRKANLTMEQADLYKVGKVVQERGFTSTSKDSQKWTGNWQYVIKSRRGKDISKLSSHAGEAEVLFNPDTHFKITQVMNNIIHMEEMD